MKKGEQENYLVINFKTYFEGSGKKAEKLAKIADKIARKTKKNIIIVVQETDIHRISQLVSIPVFSEHLDPIEYGAHTGKILAESLKFNGAQGVVLNHSEDRFNLAQIEKSKKIAKKNKLKTIICANDAEQAAALSNFKPDFLAVEPPELIGGNTSVSKAKPEIIIDTVKKVRKTHKKQIILCGAGIKTAKDVKTAIKLGTQGVFVASGVVKSKTPEKKIRELVKFL
jgi:triosephosphate isomerase (TIM)